MVDIDEPADRQELALRTTLESARTMVLELTAHSEGERREQYDEVWALLSETIETLDDVIAGTVVPPHTIVRRANYSIVKHVKKGEHSLPVFDRPEDVFLMIGTLFRALPEGTILNWIEQALDEQQKAELLTRWSESG